MNTVLLALALPLLAADAPKPAKLSFAAALQAFKKDGSEANREALIKAAAAARPAPAIPADARRPFVMAATYQKEAKTPADFGLAVDSYHEALKAAPWWGDAYYNLSVALESAGRLPEAKRALERYLLSSPKDAEAAQDRLFALEAKEKLAAQQVEAARRDPRGRWDNGGMMDFEIVERDGALRLIPGDLFARPGRWRAAGVQIEGRKVIFGVDQPGCPQCFARYDLTLSADGTKLEGSISTGTDHVTFLRKK